MAWAFVLSVLIILNSEIGLLLFIAIMPLHALLVNKFHLIGAWKELILILIFMGFVFKRALSGRLTLVRAKVNGLIVLFIFYCTMLLLVNITEFKTNILGLRNLVQYCLVYFLTINIIRKKENLKIYITIILFFGLLIAAANTALFLFNSSGRERFLHEAYDSSTRLLALDFLGANNYPVYLATIFCLALGLFLFQSSRRIKAMLFLEMVVMFFSIILTFSRAAIFGLLLALIFWGLKYSKKFILVLLLCCFIGGWFMPLSIRERFLTYESYKESVAVRSEIIAKNKIYKYNEILFGCGLGRVGTAGGDDAAYPHNYYMYLLLQTGVIGLGIYLLMFLVFFKTSLSLVKKFKDNFFKGLAAGIVMYYILFAVNSLFMASGEAFLSAFLFWFLGAVVMILDNDGGHNNYLESVHANG